MIQRRARPVDRQVIDSMLEDALYQGETLRVERLPGGFAELCFDRQGSSVNKFDRKTVAELNLAIAVLDGTPGLRGNR